MFKFKELDPRLKLTWCLFLVLTALVSRSMVLNGVLLGLILVSELLSEKSLKAFKMLSIVLLIIGKWLMNHAGASSSPRGALRSTMTLPNGSTTRISS